MAIVVPEAVKKEALSWARLIAEVAAIVLAFNTVAFAQFDIPSGSMIPTLKIGDRFAVSKFAYGYSVHSLPFGIDRLFPSVPGRLFGSAPERGDIVVFAHPQSGDTFVKRVVGLPGDRIAVQAGRLVINGELVPLRFLRELTVIGSSGVALRVQEFEETLPGGVTHIIRKRPNGGHSDTMEERTVPADHYFMVGDNRDNSSDSREWGYVPAERLIGRGEIITVSFAGCEIVGGDCGWRSLTWLD